MSFGNGTHADQRRGTAAIAAAGVAAILFIQDLFGTGLFVLGSLSDGFQGGYLEYLLHTTVYGILVFLALAGGVWVSLRLLAPVTADTPLASTIRRGVLAAAVGAVLVFVVNLGAGLIGPLSTAGSLFGNSFPHLSWGTVSQAGILAFQQSLGGFLQQAPVVVLVVLLVWIWLGRHPSRHAVSADAAEV